MTTSVKVLSRNPGIPESCSLSEIVRARSVSSAALLVKISRMSSPIKAYTVKSVVTFYKVSWSQDTRVKSGSKLTSTSRVRVTPMVQHRSGPCNRTESGEK